MFGPKDYGRTRSCASAFAHGRAGARPSRVRGKSVLGPKDYGRDALLRVRLRAHGRDGARPMCLTALGSWLILAVGN